MKVRALRKVVLNDVHFWEKVYRRGECFWCDDYLLRSLKGKVRVLFRKGKSYA